VKMMESILGTGLLHRWLGEGKGASKCLHLKKFQRVVKYYTATVFEFSATIPNLREPNFRVRCESICFYFRFFQLQGRVFNLGYGGTFKSPLFEVLLGFV